MLSSLSPIDERKEPTTLEISRPDVTTEGWHTWPTEKVMLVPAIRDVMESALRCDGAEELRESLITFALSRVDWLQPAAAEIEAAIPEEPDLVGSRALQVCAA